MISACNDNVLNAAAPVIPVNLVGVMGKGLALQAKNKWPKLFDFYRDAIASSTLCDVIAYEDRCDTRPVAKVAVWPSPDGQMVILAPTKRHWQRKSPPELVAGAINAIPDAIEQVGARMVNLPPIGCGLGGLEHRAVLDWITAAEQRHPHMDWVLHRWPRTLTAACGIQER